MNNFRLKFKVTEIDSNVMYCRLGCSRSKFNAKKCLLREHKLWTDCICVCVRRLGRAGYDVLLLLRLHVQSTLEVFWYAVIVYVTIYETTNDLDNLNHLKLGHIDIHFNILFHLISYEILWEFKQKNWGTSARLLRKFSPDAVLYRIPSCTDSYPKAS